MLEREDLASDDPRKRTPRRGKKEDINTHECYACFLSTIGNVGVSPATDPKVLHSRTFQNMKVGDPLQEKSDTYAATLCTMMAPAESWLVVKVPSIATRNWEAAIPIAPQNSRGRRPNLSTAYKPGRVENTLMTDVII